MPLLSSHLVICHIYQGHLLHGHLSSLHAPGSPAIPCFINLFISLTSHLQPMQNISEIILLPRLPNAPIQSLLQNPMKSHSSIINASLVTNSEQLSLLDRGILETGTVSDYLSQTLAPCIKSDQVNPEDYAREGNYSDVNKMPESIEERTPGCLKPTRKSQKVHVVERFEEYLIWP